GCRGEATAAVCSFLRPSPRQDHGTGWRRACLCRRDLRAKRGGTVVAARVERSALERRIGVKFKDGALLKAALVHSSFVNENPQAAPESNERLEFLGDAVLGLVVADDLYAAYPDQDEGQLTELRTLL